MSTSRPQQLSSAREPRSFLRSSSAPRHARFAEFGRLQPCCAARGTTIVRAAPGLYASAALAYLRGVFENGLVSLSSVAAVAPSKLGRGPAAGCRVDIPRACRRRERSPPLRRRNEGDARSPALQESAQTGVVSSSSARRRVRVGDEAPHGRVARRQRRRVLGARDRQRVRKIGQRRGEAEPAARIPAEDRLRSNVCSVNMLAASSSKATSFARSRRTSRRPSKRKPRRLSRARPSRA